jgi:hypothetical protein
VLGSWLGVALVDTTGKSHLRIAGARSLEVTPWPVRFCGGVGAGRSFVAQPLGVSRFDRARPRPGWFSRVVAGV